MGKLAEFSFSSKSIKAELKQVYQKIRIARATLNIGVCENEAFFKK